MKRAGIGLSFAAALGLIACASEELDQPPPAGTAGRGAGGNHAGNGGRGGSSPSGTPGGQANHGGTIGSIGGTSSDSAGMPGVGGLVGTSGSVGLGGNAGSGGSSPVFESGVCASSPSMSLSYQQASNNPKQITALYQFSNTTDTPIPLAELKIRYFFSNEETSGWKTAIHDAKLEGGTLGYRSLMGAAAIVVAPLGTTVPGADSYIELSFNSALTIEKGAIGTVKWDLQPVDYNPPDQDQTSDYSYNAKAVAFTVWDHVVIYQGNSVVWGCTPKEASGSGGSGGVGGSGVGGSAGALGGSAGTSGSGTDNGGTSSGGLGGSAGGNAGAGGDTTIGGSANGGIGGASGAAGSNLGGASGNSGAGGNQPSGGSGGSSSGNGGSSGSN